MSPTEKLWAVRYKGALYYEIPYNTFYALFRILLPDIWHQLMEG